MQPVTPHGADYVCLVSGSPEGFVPSPQITYYCCFGTTAKLSIRSAFAVALQEFVTGPHGSKFDHRTFQVPMTNLDRVKMAVEFFSMPRTPWNLLSSGTSGASIGNIRAPLPIPIRISSFARSFSPYRYFLRSVLLAKPNDWDSILEDPSPLGHPLQRKTQRFSR
jgi:hypothetical protein